MKSKLLVAIATLGMLSVPFVAKAATSTPTPTSSLSSTAKALSSKQIAEAQKKLRTVLYSVTANSGTLMPLAGVKNGYSLVLRGADPSTTWFTDRPYRDSGVLPTQALAKSFALTKDPANVALVLHQPTQGSDTLVAVMRRSAYNTATQTFTAELRLLNSQEQGKVTTGLKRHVKRADTAAPAAFKEVSLFIDTAFLGTMAPSASYPPNPQIGDTYQMMGPESTTLYQFVGIEGWVLDIQVDVVIPPLGMPYGFGF